MTGGHPLVNIGVGIDQTVREMAEAVAHAVGYTGELQFDPRKPDGTPQKLIDISLLRSLVWQPRTSFEQGLAYADFKATLVT